MAVPAIDRARAVPTAMLIAILFAGGALNGFAVRIMESWRLNAGAEILLGISPFELIVLAIALDFIIRSRPEAIRLTVWAEVLLLIGLIIPSSTASWASLAAYAAVMAWRGHGAFRLGALLILGLAAAALWSAVGVNWVARLVTSSEASLVAALLRPLRPDIVHDGNLIGVRGAHEIVLIVACTTANALPRVLLAVVAISAFVGGGRHRLLAPLCLIALAYGLANWIRLAAMAWSAESYALVHGPVGANIFDLAQSVMVLAAGTWLGRR